MADLMSLIHQAGFTGQAAQIMYGIVMAESGGNANAHNTNAGTGDNSYGLAQINMLGSMGPARLAQYGLSSNEQLFDPLTNLKVAFAMSGGGTHFGDWSTYNSGAYQQFSGQSGMQVQSRSATPVSGTAGNPTMTGPNLQKSVASALGPLADLLTAVPELNAIMVNAIRTGVQDPNEVVAQLYKTKWWRTHSDTFRSYFEQQIADPATWRQNLTREYAKIQEIGGKLGITNLGPASIDQLAHRALVEGWSDTELSNNIAAVLGVTKRTTLASLKGDMAGTAQQIMQMAREYGVPYAESSMAYNAQQILEGRTTLDTYKNYMLQQAKSMYPGYAAQLDGGMTMKQVADPYIATKANLLEINPNTINFANDPLIKKALQGAPAAAGQPPTATPLWQFEQQVRANPAWQTTNNAQQQTAGVLTQLGKDWGMVS